jgi:hypothetical protein
MSLSRQAYTTYEHTQAVASATWSVNHNLMMYPIVDVFVDIGGNLNKIIPAGVTYIDNNNCDITFSTPYSGYATVS